MERVGGDAGAVEPAGELTREEDVGELGLRVDGEAAVVTGRLQVVEIETVARTLVRVGRDVDDPGRRTRAYAVEEQVGEQEVPEVVDAERHLEALDRLLAPLQHQA